MIQPKKPTNGLTEADNKILVEELTKYANEGATDSEMKEFRETFITAKKKSTSKTDSAPVSQPQKSASPSSVGSSGLVGQNDPFNATNPLRTQKASQINSASQYVKNNYDKYKQAEVVSEEKVNSIRQEVDAEANNEGFLNKARTLLATGASMIPSFLGGTSGKDIDPLYKEKEQAKKELAEINLQAKKEKKPEIQIDDATIAERAKEIKVNKKIKSERDTQVNAFLTDLENTTSGPNTKNARQELETYQARKNSSISEKDKTLLKKQDVIRDAAEFSLSVINDIKKDAAKYEKNGQPIPKELQDQYEIAVDDYKRQVKEATDTHNEYVNNKKELGTAKDNLDELKRDYSWLQNFKGNVIASTIDLAAGGAGFMDYASSLGATGPYSQLNALQYRSAAKKMGKEAEEIRGGIMKPIDVESIHSMEDFGRWMSNTVIAQQVPVYVAAASGTGGIAALGVSATGQKFEEMQSEVESGDADYSRLQMAAIPLAFGATEAASATVDAMIIKGAGRTIRSATAPERKLMAEGMWSQLKKVTTGFAEAAGEGLKGGAVEGLDEAATQLSQNLIDKYAGDKKNINIWDGVKDSAAAGAVMGFFIPFGAKTVSTLTKPFSTDSKIENTSAQILKLEEQLANPELSDKGKKIVEKLLVKNETKLRGLVQKTATTTAELGDEKFNQVVKLEKRQASLKEQAKVIEAETSMDEETKAMALDDLKTAFDNTNQTRLNILNNVTNEPNTNKKPEQASQPQAKSETQVNEVTDVNDTNVVNIERDISVPLKQNVTENEAIQQDDTASNEGNGSGISEVGKLGEGRGTEASVIEEENIQSTNDSGRIAGSNEVETATQEIESRRENELTELKNNPDAIEEDGEYYIPGPNGVENSTQLINEKYDAEIAKLPTSEQAQNVPASEIVERSRTFEPKSGKKSVVNRLYEGDTRDSVKKVAEDLGLTYEVENQEQAENSAKSFVDKVGINGALNAARSGTVKGAEKAFVYGEVLNKIQEAIDNADPEDVQRLEEDYFDIQNQAVAEFDELARESGRFISALNRIYNNSAIKYNLTRQIDRYKAVNNGEIDDATLAKFKEADKNIKELEAKLKEAEKRALEAEMQQAMDNINESVDRANSSKKTAKQSAKTLANKIRKVKIARPDAFNAATVSVVWDTAIEIVAKTIEAGGTLADAIEKGKAYIRKTDWYKKLSNDKREDALSQFEASLASANTKEVVTVNEDGTLNIPNSVIRTLVEMGARDINDLSQKILDMISEENPEITLREVRDAVTKYGKTINPTKDAIQKEINLMKRLGRLISANEDVDEGNRPLRSGLQREKATQEERKLKRQLTEKLRDLPLDNAQLDKEWKNTLDKIKERLKNQIEDLNKQIEQGEKRKPERTPVAYDEEATALKEKRDELKDILDEMVGKPELTNEQKVQRAINQLENSISKTKDRIESGNIGFNERAKPLNSAELDALRKTQKQLNEQLTQMRKEAGLIEKRKLSQAKERIAKQIKELQSKIENKDYSKKKAEPQLVDDEILDLRSKLLREREVYDKAVYQQELKNRPVTEKIWEGIVGAANIFRILKATGEFSPVLVQGGIYTINMAVRKPMKLAKAFGKMFAAFGSAKTAELYEARMKASPNYDIMKASKLALVEPDYKLELREEIFIGNYINNIWNYLGTLLEKASGKAFNVTETIPAKDKLLALIKKDYQPSKVKISEQFKQANPLLAFERGLTVYMNELRMDRFNDGVTMLEMEGKNIVDNKKDYDKVATAINTMTGRANMPKTLVQASPILGAIFFSFRNTLSIVNQINPIWYALQKDYSNGEPWYKPSLAQKMAVYDMLRFVTITTSMMYLYKAAAGDDDEGNPNIEIEIDPRSADYMKMKQGNVRFDAFHGMLPMVTFFMRQFTGETKSKGEVKELGSGNFTPTRSDLLVNLGANKLSPQAGIVWRYMNQRVDKEGNKVDKFGKAYDLSEELDLTPIYINSLKEISKEDPDAFATFLAAMGLFGINSQVYDSSESKKEKEPTDDPTRRVDGKRL